MKSVYLNFLKRIIIFSVAFALICFIVGYFLPSGFITPALPYLFLFFLSVTLVVHYVLLKASEKRFSKFTTYFMLALLNRSDAIPFIITFFILYIFYTVFEVISILSYSKS
jgi:hypothetical protein